MRRHALFCVFLPSRDIIAIVFWSSFCPYFGTCWCKMGVACHSVELDLDAEFVPAFFFGVTRAQSCRVFGSGFRVILVWKQHSPSCFCTGRYHSNAMM